MKKYQKGIITTLGIIVGIFILNIIISTTTGVNVLSNTINYVQKKMAPNKEEVKSIELSSDDYDASKGGSYKIDKSAHWTGTDTAQINFNVNTKSKRSTRPKDIILVLDTSGSMRNQRIASVKKDTTEFISKFLENKENRISIISFDSKATVLSDWTSDPSELTSKINAINDKISTSALTNYYQALIEVDKLLESYEKKDGRDLSVFFLTDGLPCDDRPNEITQYKLLKEKYPYLIINGVQYEMGRYIRPEIKNISDYQYSANSSTLASIMNDVIYNIDNYEKFELIDYIDNDYFYVEDVNDIKVSIGKVELTEENGVQKVIWTAEPNEFRTGSSANMIINLKLKKQYVGNEGYYPTNKKFEVTTKLPNEKEIKQTTDKTPILKAGYKVSYDTNTPTGCEIANFEETHYSFEKVKIADKLSCEGYTFKGWKIIDPVSRVNVDYFIMPSKDVTLTAQWSKQDISKSMDGTVHEAPPSIMKAYSDYSNDDYHNGNYKSKVTKIVFSDNTGIPTTAIEHWDVSKEGNGSVIAYIEDDGTGNGTYKVTIGGNGKVIANEDSSYLFRHFSRLKEIDLRYFDTSNVTDMSFMFSDCGSLTTLDVSNFDTSKVTNMGSMFYGCSNLTTLDLSNFDTSKVTDMSYMFTNSRNITTIDVSNFDTGNVTNMWSMFDNCSNLTTLDVSNFNTSNVTNMGYMFSGCNSLTTLDVSNFNTSNVKDMSNMFRSCNNLTTIGVSNFDTSEVTNMSSMFENCRSLTALDVSNFDTSKVTDMNSMFYYCSSLTTLDVSNFDTSKVTNMADMFENCSNLTTLDVSNFDTSNVTNMGYMFSDCKKLTTTINIRPTRVYSYNSMFSRAATDDGASITVNYTSENSALVDRMIATKSSTSHVVKGNLITD